MTANVKSKHLTSEQLQDLIGSALPIRPDVESHLSDCDLCAARLSSLAARSWSWEEVSSRLTSDEFDSALAPGHRDKELAPPNGGETRGLFEQVSCADVDPRDDRHHLTRELSGWLAPSDDPRMLGRFAGYEVVGVIGHGGMGIVLKGFEPSLNRYVAIKLLAPRLASSGPARQRFAREARAAAAVLHENVISVHRVDEWQGLPFLVMPYVAGESLEKRIQRQGALPAESAVRIAAQIAAGLAAAHAQGLVHRDIKPANILLENGVERVTITDFGLARAADDRSLTRVGMIAGTPQYMSPEQAQARPLDHRSDLFSLGSVLYAMVAGEPPFCADDQQVLQEIVNSTARDVRDVEPTAPPWLADIIAWLLERDPNDRPQSATEVAEMLSAWLAHMRQPTSTAPPTKPPAARRKGSAGPRFDGLAIAAATLAAFLGIFTVLAVLIVLSDHRGTIRIESAADDIPIRVTREGESVKNLTVTREGASVRVAAGTYRVEVDGDFDGVQVVDATVTLERKGTHTVKIITSASAPAGTARDTGAPAPKQPLHARNTRNTRGVITRVAQGLVSLSIGSDDGVRQNMIYQVIRDGRPVGTVQVTHVAADSAVARIINESADKPIGMGDDVRLFDLESEAATDYAHDVHAMAIHMHEVPLTLLARTVMTALRGSDVSESHGQDHDSAQNREQRQRAAQLRWLNQVVAPKLIAPWRDVAEQARSLDGIADLGARQLSMAERHAMAYTTQLTSQDGELLSVVMFFEKPHEAWRLHNLSLVPRARAEESFRRFQREHPDAMVVMTSPERSSVETPQRQADPARPHANDEPHKGGEPNDDKPAAREESAGFTAPEHGDWVVAWDEHATKDEVVRWPAR